MKYQTNIFVKICTYWSGTWLPSAVQVKSSGILSIATVLQFVKYRVKVLCNARLLNTFRVIYLLHIIAARYFILLYTRECVAEKNEPASRNHNWNKFPLLSFVETLKRDWVCSSLILNHLEQVRYEPELNDSE